MLSNIKTFLRTGVAQATPVSQYKWRTLPSLARGVGGTVEQVLESVKSEPSSFRLRFGRRGDVYVANASDVDGGFGPGED